MTREEATKRLREILTEATEFEDSVCYVTEEDREPLEMAIKALEQGSKMLSEIEHLHKYISKLETQIVEQEPIDKSAMMYDIYMEGVNMSGEYQGCWVRFKDIEKIVDKYIGSEE